MALPHEVRAMVISMLGMIVALLALLFQQRQRHQQEFHLMQKNPTPRRIFFECQSNLLLLITFMHGSIGDIFLKAASQYGSVGSITGFYVKPRSLDWWNHYVLASRGDDIRFRELFRLPIALFEQLSDLLRVQLEQGPIPPSLATVSGRLISLEK